MPALRPVRSAARPRCPSRSKSRRAIWSFFNGLGGFTPRRPRVRHHHHRRRAHARAVGQRAGQPVVRHRRQRERRRLHLVRERPRVPPDALAQRSGQRRQRRGVLPPRRGDRPLLVAHAAARARRDALHHAATASATASSSTPRTASRSELWIYVAIDAPVKFVVAQAAQRLGPAAPALASPAICEWVLGDLRREACLHVVTEVDPKTGALFARNAYNSEFAERVAFLDVQRSRSAPSPATAPSSSAATARPPAPPP